MNGLWEVLRHQVLIPLALPIALVLLALVLRTVRVLWFRFRQGGFPPIAIHATDSTRSRAFAASLSEYLEQEAPGPTVIIPPGSGTPPPPVPVELSGRSGWVGALISIVLSREPAFDVYVECPSARMGADPTKYQVIIRITRVPGNHVLAADHLDKEREEDLIDEAGCLIIHSVRQQPGALRHTPRWERWSSDIKGYSLYRRALDDERNNQKDSALDGYNKALRDEPGSFLITIRKAALLEGIGKFPEACDAYRTCNELWPEHIETAYRLAASYANDKDPGASEAVLEDIKERLKRRNLWGEWWRTWWITRWNAGERNYWWSWLRHRPPLAGPSNRKQLCVAVEIAKQVRGMGRIVFPDQNDNVNIDDLITRMADLTTRRTSLINPISSLMLLRSNYASPYIQLFHPDRLIPEQPTGKQRPYHDSSWHDKRKDKDLVIHPLAASRIPKLLRPRKRIGWLAHYNAACFYSLALNLDPSCLHGFTAEEWRIDCTRAAIRELGYVRRDPHNKLEPDWYKRDPELEPLREHLKGTRWAELVGL